jgi:hypothetical protein
MTNSFSSVVRPHILKENMQSIVSFLKYSYESAKKNIQDTTSFFKEEFTFFYDKTGTYVNRMLLPVNNFLKDLTQIDSELNEEINKEQKEFIVPLEKAVKSPMEENY